MMPIKYEYLKAKLGIEDHAKNFKAIEARYPCDVTYRFYDPSAVMVSSTLAASHNYVSSPALNSIRESVDLINLLLYQGKIKVDSRCQYLIESMELLEWKETGTKSKDPFQKLPKHLGHADLIASLRYAIYTHYKMFVETNFEICAM